MKKGFTLIELLVVIAILGTIAVVALLALDPLEQLRRTRDGGKLSTVAQLGHAVEAYSTVTGAYPPATAAWGTTLTSSGDISALPQASGLSCAQNAVNSSWCYNMSASGAVVFSLLESARNDQLCPTPASQVAWAVYSTAAGRGGIVCTANATTYPAPGVSSFVN